MAVCEAIGSKKPITEKNNYIFIQERLENLEWFAENIIGIRAYKKQREIFDAIMNNDYTTIRSANGVGKTFSASIIILWYLTTHPGSIVITTAPTWRQVESILWQEIRKNYSKALYRLGGEMMRTRWQITDKWFAIGLSTDDPVKFQGYHSDNIFVVFEEAAGIEKEIWEASKGLLTSNNAKFLAIGNPTHKLTDFYRTFNLNKFNKMKITAYDSPNVTGEMHIPGLVTQKWIDEMITEYGANSNFVRNRINAEFSDDSDDEKILTLSDIEKVEVEKLDNEVVEYIGVDVARFGDDESVISLCNSEGVLKLLVFKNINTMQLCGQIMKIINENKTYKKVIVDEVGIGAGVVDRLKEQGIKVEGVNVGRTANNNKLYNNLKAELYWELRKAIKEQRIKLIKNEKLKYQLADINYNFTSSGKLQIEKKESIKKRGLKSPDTADSVILGLYYYLIQKKKKIFIG